MKESIKESIYESKRNKFDSSYQAELSPYKPIWEEKKDMINDELKSLFDKTTIYKFLEKKER